MRALIGCGGAGVNILTSHPHPGEVRSLGILTGPAHPARGRHHAAHIHRTSERELGSWKVKHPSLARQFLGIFPSRLREAFASEFTVCISALGGTTGTLALEGIISLRGPLGLGTACMCVLPFSVEGERRVRGERVLASMRRETPCIVFDNDSLTDLIPGRGVAETFRVVNALILDVSIYLLSVSEWEGIPPGAYRPIMGSGPEIDPALLTEGYLGDVGKDMRLLLPEGFEGIEDLVGSAESSGYRISDVIEMGAEGERWLAILPLQGAQG